MNIGGLRRRVQRLNAIYREVGIVAVITRVVQRLLRAAGTDNRDHAGWLRNKAIVDMAFDRDRGTDTGGIDEIFDLSVVGQNSRHGFSHIASSPDEFHKMMPSLKLAHSLDRYTFIDLGCGKGRALLLAAQYPFAKIIGVEFAKELLLGAETNIRRAISSPATRAKIQLVLADAATYEFPTGPLLVYLFNPFDSIIVREVARNARAARLSQERSLVVVYMNPQHLDEFSKEGWKVTQNQNGWAQLR